METVSERRRDRMERGKKWEEKKDLGILCMCEGKMDSEKSADGGRER